MSAHVAHLLHEFTRTYRTKRMLITIAHIDCNWLLHSDIIIKPKLTKKKLHTYIAGIYSMWWIVFLLYIKSYWKKNYSQYLRHSNVKPKRYNEFALFAWNIKNFAICWCRCCICCFFFQIKSALNLKGKHRACTLFIWVFPCYGWLVCGMVGFSIPLNVHVQWQQVHRHCCV